jgi:FkbM family methyltransferase
MDLCRNDTAEFTKWVVTAGLLREPFVLVDVGVQDGENLRWHLLGDHLVVHGFDPVDEAIDRLIVENAQKPNRHYHRLALGSCEEERVFYFNAANPTASSMYSQGVSRFEVETTEQPRKVRVRRLDTLLAEGVIPRADFLKVDVEGFEIDVFQGAQELLAAGVLGVEAESNFGISAVYPRTHLAAVAESLLGHGLLIFDLAFNRIPRASFQRALEAKGLAAIVRQDRIGKPSTLSVLFCRDPIHEADESPAYLAPLRPLGPDQLIKLMIIYELHGLNDIAVDTAGRFAELLGSRIDVDRAIALLADPSCRDGAFDTSLERRIREFEQSTSWRVTAPLRALKRTFEKLAGSGAAAPNERSRKA